MSLETLLGQPLRVINVGLDAFALELKTSGIAVVHVDWRPPAGGDLHLLTLLARLDEDDDG